MKKIVITATAESYEQARELLELGVDRIYIGEKTFGLRLPKPLSFAEMRKIAELVHESGKELTVAVNALMHQSMMDALPDYLDFLEEIKNDTRYQSQVLDLPAGLLMALKLTGD